MAKASKAKKIENIAQAARDANLPPGTVYARLRKGWSLERALSEPVNIKKRKDAVKKAVKKAASKTAANESPMLSVVNPLAADPTPPAHEDLPLVDQSKRDSTGAIFALLAIAAFAAAMLALTIGVGA